MNEYLHIVDIRARRMVVLLLIFVVAVLSTHAQQEQRAVDTLYRSDSGSAAVSDEQSTQVSNDSSHTEDIESSADSVQFRSVPDSVLSNFRSDKDFAYANDPSYWVNEPVKHEKNFMNGLFEWLSSKSFKTILYVLIASILVFALYKIVIENKMFIFYAPPPADEPESKLDLTLDPVDLEERIRMAIQESDLQSATRWMYIKALSMLNEAGLIRHNMQSTNQHYIEQMQSGPHVQDFKFLSIVFEQVCYGGFRLNWTQFHMVKSRFEKFFMQLAQ